MKKKSPEITQDQDCLHIIYFYVMVCMAFVLGIIYQTINNAKFTSIYENIKEILA